MGQTPPLDQHGSAAGGDVLALPTTLDQYDLLFHVAEGGMGQVYLGRKAGSASGGQMVIVKTLRGTLVRESGSNDLFLDETRVAAALRHPNIVRVYDVGCARGIHYIAMEYVHGDTLANMLATLVEQRVRLSYVFVAAVVRDVALALDYAYHRASTGRRKLRVVHRDIKPANIMVDRDGRARLIDFGIARATSREVLTDVDTVRGTQCYMAPEQAQGERDLDGRCDQFSLGVVMWELCTGARLFEAATPILTLSKLLKEKIPPPSSVRQGVPAALEDVVMRMLERMPGKRFSRCAEVAKKLDAFLRTQRVGDVPGHVAAVVARLVGEPLDARLRAETTSEVPRARGRSNSDADESCSASTRCDTSDDEARPTAQSAPTFLQRVFSALLLLAAAVVVLAGGWWWVQRSDNAPTTDGQPALLTSENLAARGAELLQSVKQHLPSLVQGEPLPSRLTVTSVPSGAMVHLDGRSAGKTPVSLKALAPHVGHELRVSLPGHRPQTEQVTLEPGKERVVRVRFGKRSRPRKHDRASRSTSASGADVAARPQTRPP